jgi:hypothetical protein
VHTPAAASSQAESRPDVRVRRLGLGLGVSSTGTPLTEVSERTIARRWRRRRRRRRRAAMSLSTASVLRQYELTCYRTCSIAGELIVAQDTGTVTRLCRWCAQWALAAVAALSVVRRPGTAWTGPGLQRKENMPEPLAAARGPAGTPAGGGGET